MSVKASITAQAFQGMPDPPGKRLELVPGEVVEVSLATMRHGMFVATLASVIGGFVHRHDLGLVAVGAVGYILRRNPDAVRTTDVSFVAWAALPDSGLPDRSFWEGAPTLAVEVVSPDDRASEVHAKVRQFLEAGTHQVWVLRPDSRSVTLHDRDGIAREIGPDADLDGGDVLPGFTVPVSTLFAIRQRR